MLIFTRRVGELSRIGETTVIQVMNIKNGDEAVIGIFAPKEIPIDREKIKLKKVLIKKEL